MSVTCDTSVLVPAIAGWHPAHAPSRAALSQVRALPAHVLLECFSVLTRLPGPHALRPADAAAALEALPFPLLTLSSERHAQLPSILAGSGLKGGAVYDGLVAATAAEHGYRLLSRDHRALPTYDAVGVSVQFVEN